MRYVWKHLQSIFKKTREYLDYVENHINNINLAWDVIKNKCKDLQFIKNEKYFNFLDNDIKKHDISKLSINEFIQYRQYFYPLLSEKNNNIIKEQFNSAQENHKKENMHHQESQTKLNNETDKLLYCVLMIIDQEAMSYKFNDTAQLYYEKNKHIFNLSNDIENFIYSIFNKIYN